MRLVAVSIVKNEADIIEAFARHTAALVDHHLVFDHDSTDGTREILGALKREGLALTLFTDDTLGNLQQARSHHLSQLAVERFRAEWVMPLDADEILTVPSRTALEEQLSSTPTGRPVSLHLVDYCPTTEDDPAEKNPVLRLRHCRPAPSLTKKVFIPAALVRDPTVLAGKGSHDLRRDGQPLPDKSLPSDFLLSHLALRSAHHQALRVVLAELQRTSQGKTHAGLDTHYRLGYQSLASDPELFFEAMLQPAVSLRHRPIRYLGAPLRFSGGTEGWSRVVRALLPFLDKLASSHGALLDRQVNPPPAVCNVRELAADDIPPTNNRGAQRYAGFTALEGWGPQEGPVPEAYLPTFHWGYAPATRLEVHSHTGGPAQLLAELLTYSDGQSVEVTLNGLAVSRHVFGRVNQRENLLVPLVLRAGANELALHYRESLVAPHDPRRLAALFLHLRITSGE